MCVVVHYIGVCQLQVVEHLHEHNRCDPVSVQTAAFKMCLALSIRYSPCHQPHRTAGPHAMCQHGASRTSREVSAHQVILRHHAAAHAMCFERLIPHQTS